MVPSILQTFLRYTTSVADRPGLDLDTLGRSFNSEILSKKMKKWRRQCITVGRRQQAPAPDLDNYNT